METDQNPSPEIAGVIDSLPQAGSETQGQRKRTYTKRRRKKTVRRTATAREAFKLNVPSSDEEPRSRMFLTTVANLLLLVAVLTIVFAAHRAVQNRQQAEPIQPSKSAEPAQLTQPAGSTVTEAKPTEQSEPTQQTELTEPAQDTEQSEPAKPTKPVEPAKRAKPVNRFSSDPYTNSGPLDLDRQENILASSSSVPNIHSNVGSDYKNPWNSGGTNDLDSEANRQQYKKALSLAE